jgi:RNA recognition motif-containing protein
MDMYHLFSPFGNLLSVRIMVEKESGRSRGFGFVSYDSPDAAAIAIKELNGYTVRTIYYWLLLISCLKNIQCAHISSSSPPISDWQQALESTTQANSIRRTTK